MPDGSQTYSYTNTLHRYTKIKNISPQTRQMNSKSVLRLSCLAVSAIAHYTNYPQQQKPDACDEIMTLEQQNQSNTPLHITVSAQDACTIAV